MFGARARRWCLTGLALLSGCTFACPGNQLADLSPIDCSHPVRVAHTVDDFDVVGMKVPLLHASCESLAAQGWNRKILRTWKDRGYVSDFERISKRKPAGNTEYTLTLHGHMYNDNMPLFLLSLLTYGFIPTCTDRHVVLEYKLTNEETGQDYTAFASDYYREWFGIIFLPLCLKSTEGMTRTQERLADHIYQQFHDQGAFQTTGGKDVNSQTGDQQLRPTPAPAAERTDQ